MPYQYTDTENDIVQRLTANLPEGYKVIPLPERERDFDTGIDKVVIVVAVLESDFEPPSSTDPIRQNETVTVLINIKSPRLRGNFSIHEAISLLKILLIGFQPANMNKLFAKKFEYDEREPGANYFGYTFTMAGKKLQMEVPPEEDLPTLILLTIRQAGDFYSPDFTGTDYVVQNDLVVLQSSL